jgi:shikimate 5-dehydrogenase
MGINPCHQGNFGIRVKYVNVKSKDLTPFFLAEVESHLRPGRLVVDIVYRPPLTPFLAAAQRAGCATMDGLWMLIHQGAKSFMLWTGRPFPVDLAREKLLEALGEDRGGIASPVNPSKSPWAFGVET